MDNFSTILLEKSQSLWQQILSHRFLKETANGTISDETFSTWMQQDYVFVQEAIPFMGILLAKAPLNLNSNLIQALSGLDQELKMFRKNAESRNIRIENVQPTPTCHAYIQFLMNTAYSCSFEEGFTVLYAAEKAYLDSWMEVKKNLKVKSPWQEFIDNWTSDGFQQWVGWLASTLDDLGKEKSQQELKKMTDLFILTARYEYMFWEMAAIKEEWPV